MPSFGPLNLDSVKLRTVTLRIDVTPGCESDTRLILGENRGSQSENGGN